MEQVQRSNQHQPANNNFQHLAPPLHSPRSFHALPRPPGMSEEAKSGTDVKGCCFHAWAQAIRFIYEVARLFNESLLGTFLRWTGFDACEILQACEAPNPLGPFLHTGGPVRSILRHVKLWRRAGRSTEKRRVSHVSRRHASRRQDMPQPQERPSMKSDGFLSSYQKAGHLGERSSPSATSQPK